MDGLDVGDLLSLVQVDLDTLLDVHVEAVLARGQDELRLVRVEVPVARVLVALVLYLVNDLYLLFSQVTPIFKAKDLLF